MIARPVDSTLPEVLYLQARVFEDVRGRFHEHWRADAYRAIGLPEFVQDDVSYSRRGVLRGLHLQHPHGQAKLVSAAYGEIWDVAVDVRAGSPTFGRWAAARLSANDGAQLFIPEGFAHGFVTLSDESVVLYKCSDFYATGAECKIRWDDPELGINWPVQNPVLGEKDSAAPLLRDIPVNTLPKYIADAQLR